MNGVQRLSSSQFTWNKYESDFAGRLGLYGGRFNLSQDQINDMIRQRVVGYCDGSSLSVRPKNDTWAVMLEDDQFEQFWCHFYKDEIDFE